MQMNKEIINGRWRDLKGEIQECWGGITSDELEKVRGNIKSIEGLIHKKFGQPKEEISEELNNIFIKLSDTFRRPHLTTND